MSENCSTYSGEDGIFWHRRNVNRAGSYRVRHPGGGSPRTRVVSNGGGENWLEFGYIFFERETAY